MEILDMIREAQEQDAEADGSVTVRELAKLMGCAVPKARKTIHEMVEAGKMEPVRVQRRNITGTIQPTWAYRIAA